MAKDQEIKELKRRLELLKSVRRRIMIDVKVAAIELEESCKKHCVWDGDKLVKHSCGCGFNEVGEDLSALIALYPLSD